jgi:hypothetical protein
MFFHWETYIYQTKQDKKYALKANGRYIFFRDIVAVFENDINSFLGLNNVPRTFFIKKWFSYFKLALLTFIVYIFRTLYNLFPLFVIYSVKLLKILLIPINAFLGFIFFLPLNFIFSLVFVLTRIAYFI